MLKTAKQTYVPLEFVGPSQVGSHIFISNISDEG